MKEAHETLYHFHRPGTEAEANLWLRRYLLHYNAQPHRSAGRSRGEDWLASLPEGGFRAMCSWERFCAFAREPERRKVGGDARITVEGVVYEVDPELAGETVVLWWGLFDRDLFVEHGERRFGPYRPSGGPIPLHRYRKPSGPRATSGPTGSPPWRRGWRCPARPSPATPSSERPPRCGPPRRRAGPSSIRTRSGSSSTLRRSRPSAPSPTSWACRSAGSRPRSAPRSTPSWARPSSAAVVLARVRARFAAPRSGDGRC